MSKIYDLLILGSGPAGLSAGIYAGRAKLNTLIIEKGDIGGQVNTTSEVVNYPGIKNISGPKLMDEMRQQSQDFGVNFIKSEITNVDFSQDIKVITTTSGNIKGRAVIIATGAVPRKLGFPGEKDFTGRGIGYCSTCDGEFFEGLDVFVIGAGFAAAEEAIFLTRYAKKVIIIAREPEFTCAKTIADKVFKNPKIEVKFNSEILEATGDDILKSAKFINNKTKETFEYTASKEDVTFGIFVFIGYEPKTSLFKNHIDMDKFGYILTDENMRTNISGIYAAGDLRPKSLRQIVTAVSDGAIASTDAEKYIVGEKERLGIVDEPVEDSTKNEVKNSSVQEINSPGKSKLLNDALRTQLKGILSKMEKEVTLVSIVDESLEKSIELRDLVLDISSLSNKLNASIYKKGENPEIEKIINADKFPVVALLNNNGLYSGVKFHGVPGGHELNSFILSIYNLAGPGQQIPKEILNRIKNIIFKTNIKICVSLSCHFCPDVVVAAQRIAIENPNVEAEMLDLSNFKDIKTRFKVMSVPAIIINNKDIYFGSKNIEEIISMIE